jgi:hypothetical protein
MTTGPEPHPRRLFRDSDGPSITVGELSEAHIGHRLVIRSGDFLGTVMGTLADVHGSRMLHFTTVQLEGKKEITFRNDTPVLVLN